MNTTVFLDSVPDDYLDNPQLSAFEIYAKGVNVIPVKQEEIPIYQKSD